MKKLPFILLCLIATSALGQWNGVKPILGVPIDKSHPLGDPTAVWFFLEGSGGQVFDLSLNNNTGTFSAGAASPSWVAGKFGSAIDFDGGDRIDIADAVSIQNIFTNGGTISAWIYPRNDGGGNFGRIIDKSNDSAGGWWLVVNGEAGGFVKMRFARIAGNNGAWETTNAVIPINAWSHVAVTFYDGSIHNLPSLYVNAQLQVRTEIQNPAGTFTSDVGIDAYIGDRAGADRAFDGLIDVPMLHNRILSASDITLLYREPFGMIERDNVAILEAGIAVPAGNIPIFMYHYMHHGYLLLPIIPFGFYCLWRQKCAA